MNRAIVRLTYVSLVLLAVLVVMTTYWQTWAAASLAERQDNAIKRVAEFSIDRGLIFSCAPRKRLARNRERDVDGRTLFFRSYPYGPLAAHVVGYSHGRPLADGARAVAERLPDGREREPLDRPRQDARRAPREAGPGQRRRDDARPRARRRSRSRRSVDNCGAVVALDPRTGQAARDGVVAQLRPEPRRGELRADLGDHGGVRARRAAAQPRERRPLRARLDVQGRDRGRRARVDASSRPTRPSTTPATAPSTASA